MKNYHVETLEYKVEKLKENKEFFNKSTLSDEMKKGYSQAIDFAIELFELQIEFEKSIS